MADEQNLERDTSPSDAATSKPAHEAPLDPTRQVSCPSCGFMQPEDLFCASCGKSLRRPSRQRQGVWQNPKFWVGAVVSIGAVSWMIFQSNQNTSSLNSQGDSSIFRNATQRAKLLKAEGDGSEAARQLANERRERFTNTTSQTSQAEPSADAIELGNHSADTTYALSDLAESVPSSPTTSSASKFVTGAKSRASPATEPQVAPSLSTAEPIQLHMVAAQVPPDWLASIGISAPGFHRAPGLEKVLRSRRQGLRVLSVHSEKLMTPTASEVPASASFSLNLSDQGLAGQGRLDVALQTYAPDAKRVEVAMSSTKYKTDRSPASAPPQQNMLEIDRETIHESGWVLVSGPQEPVLMIFARGGTPQP